MPAREIEGAVVARVREALLDPISLLTEAHLPIDAARLPSITRTCSKLVDAIDAKDTVLLRELVQRIVVTPSAMHIELSVPTLAARLGYESAKAASVTLVSRIRLTRTGTAVRLVHANGRPVLLSAADPGLVQLMLRAREWWSRLAQGEVDIATLVP